MKAILKDTQDKGLTLRDVSIPKVLPDEVLIKVIKTAICGTDLHIYNYDTWAKSAVKIPRVIGHEFVGKIVELGTNVTRFKTGDLVSGEGHIVCNHCRNCLAGRKHLCPNTIGLGSGRDGAFAEYLTLPQENVWPINNLNLDYAALLDPLGNATHTALSYNVVGEDILITGAGPIGLMSLLIVRHIGARFVVITDINDDRLHLAKKLGADLTINPLKESLKEAIKKLPIQEGFDIGLEMSGNVTALNDMIASMVMGGKIALLGIFKEQMPLDWNQVVFKGLFLKGVYGREIFESWYKSTVLLSKGLDISPLITHHFKYTDYDKAFKLMNEGKCSKVILEWE